VHSDGTLAPVLCMVTQPMNVRFGAVISVSPVTAVGRDLPDGQVRGCRSTGFRSPGCCSAHQA